MSETKRLIGDCGRCSLSALCLPIGPKKLAARMWQCMKCKRFYFEVPWEVSRHKNSVEVDDDCVELLTNLLNHGPYTLRWCYDCRA